MVERLLVLSQVLAGVGNLVVKLLQLRLRSRNVLG